MLRILHLSDFHYKSSRDARYRDIGEKIADCIREKEIDLVVFSGDLVFEGKSVAEFKGAEESLIKPILAATGLDNSRFIIAPGNHDLLKKTEMSMVVKCLSDCNSASQIEDFCDEDGQLQLSLTNFTHFNAFIQGFYGDAMNIEPLYLYSTLAIKGKKIGVVAFNSAWRCKESREDRGKLIFPVYMVQDAFAKVKDCDLVLCTQHHNISDYADFVAQGIEDIINEKCHILFTGHYHKASVQTTLDTDIGLLHLIAPATYSQENTVSNYGFDIIEFDETILSGKLITYKKHEDKFIVIGEEKSIAIPLSEEKRSQNDFRKLIRKRYTEVMRKADALFVSDMEGAFNALFKNPIIKDKSVQEIIATSNEGNKCSLSDILARDRSAIIFGYDKAGKTSLLRWMQLEALKDCFNRKTIPCFFDSKSYQGKDFDLMKLLREELECNRNAVVNLFQDFQLLLFIDDFQPTNTTFRILSELEKFPKHRFIATSAESMSDKCALINFEGTDVDKYYIHDITNKEIHQLTKSWPNIPNDRKKVAEEKIRQIFSQMHISFNYWTASLFLWIFEKTDPNNIHNNFELVKLYVDQLLGKDEFINSGEFQTEYGDLRSYLGYLAERIMQEDDYSLSDVQLVSCTEDYRNCKQKFSDYPNKIIEYLNRRGIIHRINGNNTIRLKGVFEFLLAFRMTENEDLLKKILEGEYTFLSFGNELEYYAGFRKDDTDTISNVFVKIKQMLSPLTSNAQYKVIDERLDSKLIIADQQVQEAGRLLERLKEIPEDDQYGLSLVETGTIDESELKPKRPLELRALNSYLMERTLFILSRMYRNSNVCDKSELSKEMLDFILDGTCNMGFLLIDEGKNYKPENGDNVENLVRLVSNFMPIIIEAFLYDAISQKNLTRVFESKLAELKRDGSNNQLKIFLMSFIIVDLDANKHFELINEALRVINKKTLRYALLNKILLLIMHYGENKELRKKLYNHMNKLSEEFNIREKINRTIGKNLIQKENKEQQEEQWQ